MTPRIIFRADGDAHIGLGHLTRLTALAEIAGSSFRRVFALRAAPASIRAEVAESVEEVIDLPAFETLAEEAAWLAGQLLQSTDLLVLDGYPFDFAYQQTVRAACGALLYLDDLRTGPQAADVVLNVAPLVPAEATTYDLRRPGARLLTGPTWAPLRAPFRAAALAPAPPAPPNVVLLCLGGADPANHTQHLAETLVREPRVQHLHVVVGASYRHWEALDAWADAQPSERLTLHRALSAPVFCQLLQACGAAVVSPSTTSYEYASAGGGLLTLLLTAENQRGIHDFLLREGLARPTAALPNLLSAPDVAHIQAVLRSAQRQWFDGSAPQRLQHLISGLVAQAHLQLRRATAADAEQVLTWTNDPVTRQFSFNSAPVATPDHQRWFASRLADPNHLFLLATVGDVPAGTIRFGLEPATHTATLSFAIGAAFRGRSLAAPLLLAGVAAAYAHWGVLLKRIIGHVLPANEASCRAFRRAGFWERDDAQAPTNSVTFEWLT